MTRTASAPLIAHLTTSLSTLAFDLWTFTLLDGTVLRWTSADLAITTPDSRVFGLGPIIQRGQVSWKRGVEVDELDVTLKASQAVLIGGVPLVQFAAADGFTGASVLLERVFFDMSMVQKGTLTWFSGSVSDIDLTRYQVEMRVRSDFKRLDVMMPRNLYQPGCLNTWGDPVCGVNRNLYAVNVAVNGLDASQARSYLQTFYTGQASTWFDLGQLKFTSGRNAGLSRTVKSHALAGSVSTFTFARPFPFPIGLNDTFTAWPGCDKTMAMCSGKYGNLPRFTGTPFIPDPETVT